MPQGRKRYYRTFDASVHTRNVGKAWMTSEQIADALTRNGDFARFPKDRAASVRRFCKINGLEVKITVDGDMATVVRKACIFDATEEDRRRDAKLAARGGNWLEDRERLLNKLQAREDLLVRCAAVLEDIHSQLTDGASAATIAKLLADVEEFV